MNAEFLPLWGHLLPLPSMAGKEHRLRSGKPYCTLRKWDAHPQPAACSGTPTLLPARSGPQMACVSVSHHWFLKVRKAVSIQIKNLKKLDTDLSTHTHSERREGGRKGGRQRMIIMIGRETERMMIMIGKKPCKQNSSWIAQWRDQILQEKILKPTE